MPPKKRGKANARAASTPVADEDAMVIDFPAEETPKPVEEPAKPDHDLLSDPWSDEQETSLFKGLMKWKPNGKCQYYLTQRYQMLIVRRT
jgi:MRG-binding protein